MRQAFTAIADEMASAGDNQAFTPVINLARDPRWGRTEETYGEDPYLSARMGVAAIEGLQAHNFMIDRHHVLATPKHFAAYGQSEGGRNLAPANYSERVFEGYVTSDGGGLQMLVNLHHVAANNADAARMALAAGVDYDLSDGSVFDTLVDQVRDGRIAETEVDKAVARVLAAKFRLGLFENPYVDPADRLPEPARPGHRRNRNSHGCVPDQWPAAFDQLRRRTCAGDSGRMVSGPGGRHRSSISTNASAQSHGR